MVLGAAAQTKEISLRQVLESKDQSRATLRVKAGEVSPHPIARYITGKFAEHLGANIYNGMDAQILRNPTLADYPFSTGQLLPDGGPGFESDEDKISQELRRQAARAGWPEPEVERLVTARTDGLATWWTREGARNEVLVSPDTGPFGGRAQRVQVRAAAEGIAQWTYLPLYRARRYQLEILSRSPDLETLSIALWPEHGQKPVASTVIKGVAKKWQNLSGTLEVEAGLPSDGLYRLALTANSAGGFVVGRILLRPADHIQGADPDVVRLLKDSHLPILRWPGGNFVSSYHWEDAVGPLERRPTRPNYAWGGVEPNLFGTDEFVAFCRGVGCEPMICVNAGDGTPEEAARWIEYCNGSARSLMGSRRAANGHPQPYKIRHWEVGNELWGRWQFHWTTPAGYVKRYAQFSKAMLGADRRIKLLACGAPVLSDKTWNDTLITSSASTLGTITDHALVGGDVSPAAAPLEVFRDFMAVPEVLEEKWAALRREMVGAGIKQPRLAVTELQMFAHLEHATESNATERLTWENLVNPGTQAEALYDVLVYHAAIRLVPFVEMVTHSATVNHGGGLRKEHERVYANPCHYAQAMFAAFAGATPVAIQLTSPREQAPLVLPELKHAVTSAAFSAIDALAAKTREGHLLMSIVHRGSTSPIHLTIWLEDFKAADSAELRTLTASVPWAANSLASPQAIEPMDSTALVQNNAIELDLPPYTVMRVRIPPRAKLGPERRMGSSRKELKESK